MKQLNKDLKPYIISLVVMFLISILFFVKPLSEGKKLRQGDIINHLGVSKEIMDYRETYNKEPLWTNRVFSGMPAYLISTKFNANKILIFHRILTLKNFTPVNFVFLYLLGFFIALILLGINPWLSLIGSIAFAFSSYFFIIIEAGHNAKVVSIAYMPPIIAGVYATFRGKQLIGSIIFGLFLALQLLVNHLQITYYTMIIIFIYLVFELVGAIKEKALASLIKPTIFLAFAVILAVGCNFSRLWNTLEYGKYSIRGKSELTYNSEDKTTGLDKSYAMQWSYGIDETLTLLIPNFKGGASAGAFGNKSKTYKLIKRYQGSKTAGEYLKSMPSYWGNQPFTSGPVYVGAAVFFLFVLGLFIVKGRIKWWLLTATIISIIFSWGKNIPGLTNFLLDNLPGYNKFRTISMTLVIAEFTIPLLGIFALKEIFQGKINKKELIRSIKYSLYIAGGLCLIFILFSGSLFSFSAIPDENYILNGQQELVDSFLSDRKSLLISDAFRSFVFIILVSIVLFGFIYSKIKMQIAILFIGVIFLFDMWPVNKRYLNERHFVTKKEHRNTFKPTTADLIILKDNRQKYKVLNLTVGIDGILRDSRTSYFHNSLGGYSGAKMRRYQELFDYRLYNDLNMMLMKFREGLTSQKVDSVLSKQSVLNMLNTRYIIYNNDAPPLVNNYELGNAWFVNRYNLVNNANEEIEALASFNPSKEVIVNTGFRNLLTGLELVNDTAANIFLTSYMPNNLKYFSEANSEQLAVFSEIYYDKGWNAYIDGKLSPHFRVNYILRAMRIPEGDHEIEFKFEPKSYYIGEKISLISSILLIFLIIGTFVHEIR